jgi:hypothetical protein
MTWKRNEVIQISTALWETLSSQRLGSMEHQIERLEEQLGAVLKAGTKLKCVDEF